ncbi:MAG: hypothetical protein AB1665_00265 [Candidatus Thermoplasmatota archaeon]
MKTYLTVMFNSDGGRPSEVAQRLYMMGFRPTHGNYDFVYDWGNTEVSVDEAVVFADRVHEALRGMNVHFKLETQIYKSGGEVDEEDVL